MKECYYRDAEYCSEDTWTCKTCGETYCTNHSHSTDLGENIECIACEGKRRNNDYNDNIT